MPMQMLTHERKIMIGQAHFCIMPNEPQNRISTIAITFLCFRYYASVIFSD